MATDVRRYRFPPLERRGLLAGLTGAQLALLGSGCVIAVLVLRSAPTAAGLLLATAVVAGAGACACWTVAGRPAGAWAPVALGWWWRRVTGSRATDAPLVGTTVAGPPRFAPPPALAGVSISAAPMVPGSPPMGVVHDVKAGTVAAMVGVHGRSFSLLDPNEKERRLAAWGAALTGLCRDGSPVHRIQWIERAVPGESDGLWRYLDQAGATAGGACRDSYAELIAGAGPGGQAHDSLLVVAVHLRRAGRAARSFGRGRAGACGLLRRELRLLQGQLRSAELDVGLVLTDRDVAAAVRGAIDPPGRPWAADTAGDTGAGSRGADAGDGRLDQGCHPDAAWPMGDEDDWSSYRSDGMRHATYWIAEWPRVDVGPDFLSPLLLATTARRVVAVTMAPVAPAQAAREVEAARTADLADEQLRRKAGFLNTARRQREAEGVIRRESELADGHAEYRYSGYVTVSAVDPAGLDLACAEIEQSARQAGLELRRLYGQQAEAFTWTLPLARGLRG